MLSPFNKPIVQLMKKQIDQPKVPVPKTSRKHDKIVPIPAYAIPYTRSGDDSGSRMVKRKTIQDVNRKIPIYPDQTYRFLLNQ